MARRKKHEDHLNHEAWSIPYADLMTLLLAFFVVMYAISSINVDKYRIVAASLKIALGGGANATRPIQSRDAQSANSILDRPSPIQAVIPTLADPTMLASVASQNRDFPLDAASLGQSSKQLGTIADNLAKSLSPLIDQKLIAIHRTGLWLEVEINSDILFDTGEATLDASAQATLDKLADVLVNVPNSIRVEGYTDNRPISTLRFPSNWELSAARAASVVHLFAAKGIAPDRLAMIGYGEYKPHQSNATEAGRNANRRVVLIIMATPPPRHVETSDQISGTTPAGHREGTSP